MREVEIELKDRNIVSEVLWFICFWYDAEIDYYEMFDGGAAVDAPYFHGPDLDNVIVPCTINSHCGDLKDFVGRRMSFGEFLNLDCEVHADTFPDIDDDLEDRLREGFKVEVFPDEDNPSEYKACLWWFE